MRKVWWAGLLAAAAAIATPAWPQSRADRALDPVIAAYERLDRQRDPISAGFEGDREAQRRWPDPRPEAAAARHAELQAIAARLDRVDVRRLSPDAALNHALLHRLTREQIEAHAFDLDRIPFENDSGFHTTPDYVARSTVIRTREDAEAWMARLAALPAYIDAHIANARRGVETGFTQPEVVVARVIATARVYAGQSAQESVLLRPFATTQSGLDAAALAAYRTRAEALYAGAIQPAFQRFAAFLEQDYLPAARPALAWRTLPGGADSYRFLVRQHTTTDMTPDAIHALGQAEVARIRGQMDAIIAEIGFAGDFAAFLAHLRSDPRFYPRTPEELLEKASEIAKRADDRLPQLFATLPRLPYGVRPVPAEIAEGYTTGRYFPGSPQLGLAGGYMVNTSRLDQRALYELPALTLHEAVPGHHLQIALAQELTGAPYFRRQLGVTAFVEGWGLYAESLGEDMGIYRTPYERFGRLSYEMWRACRLVADTGLHWLGWSLAEARRCFDENSALSPHNITTELERYVSWPGQALAYKIGELRLQGLRRDAQTRLGDRFDIRAFHDVVLGAGALPLDVLEGRVRAWVDAQATAP
jgi:uncharacterized protein (DUF885 family)